MTPPSSSPPPSESPQSPGSSPSSTSPQSPGSSPSSTAPQSSTPSSSGQSPQSSPSPQSSSAPPAPPRSLDVDGLVARTRRDRAFTLGPLSFTVVAGAPLAVLGAAGAGKSLLLAALAGLVPHEGRADRPARAAMVFQRDALDDARSALENIAVAVAARGIAAPLVVARDALARVGLADDVDKRPRQMSGGMKKRVGIARALAVAPDVIFADDPTAGLDPETSRDVLALLLGTPVQQGAPIVVVSTQDVDVVLPHVAQALVLDRGAPIFLGPPSDLARTPATAPFAVAA